MQVREIMTPDVVKIVANEPVAKAAELMKKWDVGAVPVESDGKFAGCLLYTSCPLQNQVL